MQLHPWKIQYNNLDHDRNSGDLFSTSTSGSDFQFDTYFFQMGWFNHQLEPVRLFWETVDHFPSRCSIVHGLRKPVKRDKIGRNCTKRKAKIARKGFFFP